MLRLLMLFWCNATIFCGTYVVNITSIVCCSITGFYIITCHLNSLNQINTYFHQIKSKFISAYNWKCSFWIDVNLVYTAFYWICTLVFHIIWKLKSCKKTIIKVHFFHMFFKALYTAWNIVWLYLMVSDTFFPFDHLLSDYTHDCYVRSIKPSYYICDFATEQLFDICFFEKLLYRMSHNKVYMKYKYDQ